MPTFRYVDAGVAKSAELTGDLVVAGADPSCGIVLTDPKISPIHCEFRRGAAGWRIVDLESREGTSVNGEFVHQRSLSEGDILQLGDVRGTVIGLSGAPAPAALAAAAPPPLPTARAAPPPLPVPAAKFGAPVRAVPSLPPPPAEPAFPAYERPRQFRFRAQTDTTKSVLVLGAFLVVIASIAGIVIGGRRSATSLNASLREQIVLLEEKEDWRAILALANQAEPEASVDHEVIQRARQRAEEGVRRAEAADRNAIAQREWNEVLALYAGSGGNDRLKRFEARIADFQARFGDLVCPATEQAERMRAQVAEDLARHAAEEDAAAAEKKKAAENR